MASPRATVSAGEGVSVGAAGGSGTGSDSWLRPPGTPRGGGDLSCGEAQAWVRLGRDTTGASQLPGDRVMVPRRGGVGLRPGVTPKPSPRALG